MIEPDHPQLPISRASFYDTSKKETGQNLGLMRLIDERPSDLETPFFDVRQMTWHLRKDGQLVNEQRIRRLIGLMALMPIYPKPNTSRPAKGHKTYPYLLKGLRVERPNQVWCSDITSGATTDDRTRARLVAIMDWHTRKVLAWRISNTLEVDFCPSRQIASQSPAGQWSRH
jgi:putative transposase